MKYATMILREDGSFDFYSRMNELHDMEGIKISYQYFQRELKKTGKYEFNGSTVYRKKIVRKG